MDQKKLFYVEVIKAGWVLAESQEEAEGYKFEIFATEPCLDVRVEGYSEENLVKSRGVFQWETDSSVYHEDMRVYDLTLRQACSIHFDSDS